MQMSPAQGPLRAGSTAQVAPLPTSQSLCRQTNPQTAQAEENPTSSYLDHIARLRLLVPLCNAGFDLPCATIRTRPTVFGRRLQHDQHVRCPLEACTVEALLPEVMALAFFGGSKGLRGRSFCCGARRKWHMERNSRCVAHPSDVQFDPSGPNTRATSRSTPAIVITCGPMALAKPAERVSRSRSMARWLSRSRSTVTRWHLQRCCAHCRGCLRLPRDQVANLLDQVATHTAETTELELQILQPLARYNNVTLRDVHRSM